MRQSKQLKDSVVVKQPQNPIIKNLIHPYRVILNQKSKLVTAHPETVKHIVGTHTKYQTCHQNRYGFAMEKVCPLQWSSTGLQQ